MRPHSPTPAARDIESRQRALMAARDEAYARRDWPTVNEITRKLAKLPVKGDKDYPRA